MHTVTSYNNFYYNTAIDNNTMHDNAPQHLRPNGSGHVVAAPTVHALICSNRSCTFVAVALEV